MNLLVNVMKYSLLVFFLMSFLLNSCYKPEPFPEKFVSEYEFAIPLTDSVFMVSDFESLKDKLDDYEIEKDIPVNMGIMAYSFSLGDNGDLLQWIEPRIVLDTKKFISGTKIGLKIYFADSNESEKTYFWLPDDYMITTDNTVKIIETENNKISMETFRQAKKIWIEAVFYFSEKTTVSVLKSKKIGFHFALKCRTKSALSI